MGVFDFLGFGSKARAINASFALYRQEASAKQSALEEELSRLTRERDQLKERVSSQFASPLITLSESEIQNLAPRIKQANRVGEFFAVYVNRRHVFLTGFYEATREQISLVHIALQSICVLPDDGMPGHCNRDFDWSQPSDDLPIAESGGSEEGYCRVIYGENRNPLRKNTRRFAIYYVAPDGQQQECPILEFDVIPEGETLRSGKHFRDYETGPEDYVLNALNGGTPIPTH